MGSWRQCHLKAEANHCLEESKLRVPHVKFQEKLEETRDVARWHICLTCAKFWVRVSSILNFRLRNQPMCGQESGLFEELKKIKKSGLLSTESSETGIR
jgi:hypothetical protein